MTTNEPPRDVVAGRCLRSSSSFGEKFIGIICNPVFLAKPLIEPWIVVLEVSHNDETNNSRRCPVCSISDFLNRFLGSGLYASVDDLAQKRLVFTTTWHGSSKYVSGRFIC